MTQDLLSLFDCDEGTLTRRVADALKGADDGELFVEHAQAESLTFDNGRLKGGSFNTDQGFGLRAVAGAGGRVQHPYRHQPDRALRHQGTGRLHR